MRRIETLNGNGTVILAAFALTATDHPTAAQVAAEFRHNRSLTGHQTIIEVNHHPVARLVQSMGQGRVGEQRPVIPTVAARPE